VRGIAEIQQICYAMHDAFEDYHLDIEDIISEGSILLLPILPPPLFSSSS